MAVLGVAALLLALAPVLLSQTSVLKIAQILIFGVALLGLNLVSGYTGQISLGHSAFFGIGAYVTTILVTDYALPILLTLPIAAGLGFLVGVVTGLPALRLKGHYLALVTLGFAVAFPLIVIKAEAITGGANGKLLTSRWALPTNTPSWMTQLSVTYLVILVVTLLVIGVIRNLGRAGAVRTLLAIKDNPLAASVNGVNLTREKVASFALSAAITAVAGSMYAMTAGVVAPEVFGLMLSVQLLTGLLIGGSGTILGSFLGGVVLVMLPEFTADLIGGSGANMAYGALLIAIIFFMPAGIAGGFTSVSRRLKAPGGRTAAPREDASEAAPRDGIGEMASPQGRS